MTSFESLGLSEETLVAGNTTDLGFRAANANTGKSYTCVAERHQRFYWPGTNRHW